MCPGPRPRTPSSNRSRRLPALSPAGGREVGIVPDAVERVPPPGDVRRTRTPVPRRGRWASRRAYPSAEALRVAGVLPGLIREPIGRAPLVLQEPVAVAVAVLVDPRRVPPDAAGSSSFTIAASPSPAPHLRRAARERAGWHRSSRSRSGTRLVAAFPAQLVQDLARLGVDRRDRPELPAARRGSAALRSPARARRRSVCNEVINVSRPNTVMKTRACLPPGALQIPSIPLRRSDASRRSSARRTALQVRSAGVSEPRHPQASTRQRLSRTCCSSVPKRRFAVASRERLRARRPGRSVEGQLPSGMGRSEDGEAGPGRG